MKILLPATLALTLPLAAQGSFLDPAKYELYNQTGTSYGLRLEELINITNDVDSFTFDFDAPGASVFMDLTASTIHIYGTVFGGLNTEAGYDPLQSGFWDLDFSYSTAFGTAHNDDDLIVAAAGAGLNSGSLKQLYGTNLEITLRDSSAGHPYTLRLGDGQQETEEQATAEVTGTGWIDHDDSFELAEPNLSFKVAQVPEPKNYLILGSFLTLMALVAYRYRPTQIA